MDIRGRKKIKNIYILQYENPKSNFGQDDKGLNTFWKYRPCRKFYFLITSNIWNDKSRYHNNDSLQGSTLIEKERGKWYEASKYLGG